jgi:hypothetical protein
VAEEQAMSAYKMPGRVTSAPTTITVNSGATALSTAAGSLGADSFVQFHGADLNLRVAHPFASDPLIGDDNPQVTEDGAGNANPSVDWAAKGCYDSQTKRAMWAGCGQGSNGAAGSYVRNTHAIYEENYNNGAGRWTSSRGWLPSGSSHTAATNHLYDGLCIDVTGRKLYKSVLNFNEIAVCDLDAMTWSTIAGAPQDSALRTGALEFIPTRGASGALWCYGESSNVQKIWEYQIGGSGWSQLTLTGSAFASFALAALPMSYNPRSNKVLCGGHGTDCYIIDCSTLNVTAVSAAGVTTSFELPHRAKLCKNPVDGGWLYFSQDNVKMWACSATGTWSQKNAAVPGPLQQALQHHFIVIPIDAYGVVWIVGDAYTFGNVSSSANPQAWLYKP